MNLPYLNLLHTDPIFLPGVGSLKVPTLNDIRKIGGLYPTFMEVLCLDDSELAERLNTPLSGASRYEFVVSNQRIRELYTQIFSFFFVQNVAFQSVTNAWVLTEENDCVGTIHEENFFDVCNAILICNHLEPKSARPPVFYNKRARLIYEKMKSSPLKKQRNGLRASLADIVSALSANSHTYNLFNVWGLTVYQLYDQFYKVNQRVRFDVASRQWAAYPSEKFDLSQWYNVPKQNKEE